MTKNPIAHLLDIPAAVVDASHRWHRIEIEGEDYLYRAAGSGGPETLYRASAPFGAGNPAFGAGSNPDAQANRLAAYLGVNSLDGVTATVTANA